MEIQRTQEAIEDAKWSRERSERLRDARKDLNRLLGEADPTFRPQAKSARVRAANKRARASRRQNRRR